MDFLDPVVRQHLRSDPSVFVSTDFVLALDRGGSRPDHVRLDALAVAFERRTVFLCEIASARKLGALAERIMQLRNDWKGYCAALVREAHVPADWQVRLWVFVPSQSEKVVRSLAHGLPLDVTSVHVGIPLARSREPFGESVRSGLRGEASLAAFV